MAVALGLVAALSGPGWTLKTLERVKGIEPSYSAWKAAALPLSYTRAGLNRVDPAVAAGDELTRPASGLNLPAGRALIAGFGRGTGYSRPGTTLNIGRIRAYTFVSINNERR